MKTTIALILLGGLTLAGCFGPDDDSRFHLVLGLKQNRDAWESLGIDDYQFRLRRLCFCEEGGVEVEIIVRERAIHSITVVESGDPLDPEDYDLYRTVNGLFEFIHGALDRDADRIRVEYDPDLHYPLSIDVDYYKNAVDDEFGWSASDFLAHRE